eukprot:NODE_5_length_72347_cov_1.339331.p3 type:complete len:922 gc:universal NODE_5_length_72347_cov_1.339331:9061-6296(-)
MSFLIPKQCKLNHSLKFPYNKISIIDKYNLLFCVRDGTLYQCELDHFLACTRTENADVRCKEVTKCTQYIYNDLFIYYVYQDTIYKRHIGNLDEEIEIEMGSQIECVFGEIIKIGSETGKLRNIAENIIEIVNYDENFAILVQKNQISVLNTDLELVSTIALTNVQNVFVVEELVLISFSDGDLQLKYIKFDDLNNANSKFALLSDELLDESFEPPIHCILSHKIHGHSLLIIGRNTAGDVAVFEKMGSNIKPVAISENSMITTPLGEDFSPLGSNQFLVSFYPTVSLPSLKPDIDPEDISPQPVFILLSSDVVQSYFLINQFSKTCDEMIKPSQIPMPQDRDVSKKQEVSENADSLALKKSAIKDKTTNVNLNSSTTNLEKKEKELVGDMPLTSIPLKKEINSAKNSNFDNFEHQIIDSEYKDTIIKIIHDFNSDLRSLDDIKQINLPQKAPLRDHRELKNKCILQNKYLKRVEGQMLHHLDQLLVLRKQYGAIQNCENARLHKQPFEESQLANIEKEMNEKLQMLEQKIVEMENFKSDIVVDNIQIQDLILKTKTFIYKLECQFESIEPAIQGLQSKIENIVIKPKRTVRPFKRVTTSIYSPSKPRKGESPLKLEELELPKKHDTFSQNDFKNFKVENVEDSPLAKKSPKNISVVEKPKSNKTIGTIENRQVGKPDSNTTAKPEAKNNPPNFSSNSLSKFTDQNSTKNNEQKADSVFVKEGLNLAEAAELKSNESLKSVEKPDLIQNISKKELKKPDLEKEVKDTIQTKIETKKTESKVEAASESQVDLDLDTMDMEENIATSTPAKPETSNTFGFKPSSQSTGFNQSLNISNPGFGSPSTLAFNSSFRPAVTNVPSGGGFAKYSQNQGFVQSNQQQNFGFQPSNGGGFSQDPQQNNPFLQNSQQNQSQNIFGADNSQK